MRVDVREALERAAQAELELNGNYVVLMSEGVAANLASGWSRPVQLTLERLDGSAIVELAVREVVA